MSVAYIVYVTYLLFLSREQRGIGRPKLALIWHRSSPRHTWLGHHFKGQRSRSPGRFAHRRVGASGGCSDGRQNVLAMGNCCYVAVCSAMRGASSPTGEEESGWCISWRLPAYSLFILTASVGRIVCGARRPWDETSMGRNVFPWGEVSMGRKVLTPWQN